MNLDDQMLSISNCLNTIAKVESLSFMIMTKHDVTGVKRVWTLEGWSEDDNDRHPQIWLIRPVLKDVITIHWDHQNKTQLMAQYYDLFVLISQICCKDLAKQWIKIIQPNKQASHPYKLGNSSKPQWWPLHVNHTEPDHLEREGRIDVLMLILRNPQVLLQQLAQRLLTLSWRPLARRLLDEIFYIACYDRYYHFHDHEFSLPYDYLRGVYLTVSKLRRNDARITMSLLIYESDTSDFVYEYAVPDYHH